MSGPTRGARSSQAITDVLNERGREPMAPVTRQGHPVFRFLCFTSARDAPGATSLHQVATLSTLTVSACHTVASGIPSQRASYWHGRGFLPRAVMLLQHSHNFKIAPQCRADCLVAYQRIPTNWGVS